MVFVCACPAFAASITVTGSGEALVPADTAIVSLGASARDADVLKAQEKVNTAIADIRQALLDAGIAEEDINTGYINIYAWYDYSSGMEELTGYNANSTLAIRTTDMEKIGEIIDIAFHAGANTLDGISFSASDTKEAEALALKAAVADAKTKAQILAEASELKLAGIESINESGTYSFDRGLMSNFAGDGAVMAYEEAGAGTYVRAAKVTVSASITIVWSTEE